MRRRVIEVLAVAVIGFMAGLFAAPKEAPAPPVVARISCDSFNHPCLEVILPGGHAYRVNRFRFAGPNCIAFVSLPDNQNHSYCGNDYALNWVGPSGD